MKTVPPVSQVMTAMPHSINSDGSIHKAVDMMREHSFRHLPVQKGGEVIGVLTDRDIKLASSFEGADKMSVDDVMTPDPYVVRPETSLQEVVANMAEHKYGCALVIQGNGKLVGILTATDIMRILAEFLEKNFSATSNH